MTAEAFRISFIKMRVDEKSTECFLRAKRTCLDAVAYSTTGIHLERNGIINDLL